MCQRPAPFIFEVFFAQVALAASIPMQASLFLVWVDVSGASTFLRRARQDRRVPVIPCCPCGRSFTFLIGVVHCCFCCNLEQAAKELLPAARDGGAAVNAVGQTAVLTLKGTSALNR